MSPGGFVAIGDAGSNKVVCDAGPLIHMDELGCLDLLNDFPLILIPPSVWSEVDRHRPTSLLHPQAHFVRAESTSPPTPLLASLAQLLPLHDGEFDALRLAEEQGAELFFTDDAAARLAARSLGIEAHGTVGLIVRAIRRRQRTHHEVIELLRAIPGTSTLHLKPSLLLDIIRSVEDPAK